MAYLDDDFQGYAIGTQVPFGSWIGSGFSAGIVAGGPDGTDRSLNVFLGHVTYDRGAAYLNSFTQFSAFMAQGPLTFNGGSFTFTNGPNAFAQSFTLFNLKMESDGTLTASCPTSGEFIENSIDSLQNFWSWNFLQINLTFSDVFNPGPAVNCVNIDYEIALNGKSVLAGSFLTTAPVSALANATAEVNQFQLDNGNYDAYTLDTLQAIVSYPHPGTPFARVNQGALEITTLPDDSVVETIQGDIELMALPDDSKVLVFQGVIELIIDKGRWYVTES